METTFVMIKPCGVQRGLIGEVIKRFENKGLSISGLKMIKVTPKQAQLHYKCHEGKDFYQPLLDSLLDGYVVCMAVSGVNAIKIVRLMCGATNPLEAQPGSIRGDYSADMRLNIVHSSDSLESAQYELGIYFNENEIINYHKKLDSEIFS